MSTPHYRLPIELCERVIDDLESDRHTLGACALVCSNWTQRSRFQLFSTTHVSESNARQFLELLASSSSVRSYITHLTIDIPSASHLLKIAAHPAFGRLSSVQTLHIRNIDWTSLPLANQLALERYLAQLQNTSTLVLDGVTFHDLAALLRAASAFSRVARVRLVGVEFSKYLQSNLALARASARRVPGSWREVEVDGGEAIPLVAVCLAANVDVHVHGGAECRVRTVTLRGLEDVHAELVYRTAVALQRSGMAVCIAEKAPESISKASLNLNSRRC